MMDNTDRIETQAAEAQRELERLTAEANRLQAEAEAATAAFKSTPNAKTLAAREVTAQLASNALEAIAAYDAESHAVRAAAKRIRDLRELEQLRVAMDFESITSTELGELTAKYLADAQGVLAKLSERLELYNSSFQRRNALERSLGDSRERARTDISTALRYITESLRPTFGESLSRAAIFAHFSDGLAQPRFDFTLRFSPAELPNGGK